MRLLKLTIKINAEDLAHQVVNIGKKCRWFVVNNFAI